MSYIQDFLEWLMKKHAFTDNPSVRIYVNKIENRLTFRIKKGHYLKLLTPETAKLLESIKIKITKDENGENVPQLDHWNSISPL